MSVVGEFTRQMASKSMRQSNSRMANIEIQFKDHTVLYGTENLEMTYNFTEIPKGKVLNISSDRKF